MKADEGRCAVAVDMDGVLDRGVGAGVAVAVAPVIVFAQVDIRSVAAFPHEIHWVLGGHSHSVAGVLAGI